jgi:hypothetical protein
LHLGGWDSDTLVFPVQYPDRVVPLESNSRVRFRSNPKGKHIAALAQSWFVNPEREIADAARAESVAVGQVARAAAAEYRARLATALARLKRESERKQLSSARCRLSFRRGRPCQFGSVGFA